MELVTNNDRNNDIAPQERRQLLFEYIYKNGSAKISELANRFNVSEMTIRRDIEVLEKKNLIMRTHGGVLYREGTIYDLGLAGNKVHLNEKIAIAKAARPLIEPGDLIAFDASTTGAELARLLNGIEDLTIVTNSLTVANIVAPYSNITLILVGGNLRSKALSTVGPLAADIVDHFNFTKMFFSCNAVDPVEGLTDTNVAEAEMKKIMLQRAGQRILLADSSKIGKRALVRFWPMEEIDIFVTDAGTPDEAVQVFQDLGVRVIRAEA
ncbi:DeoR/GlpR family DNA-binding transcription regulator [Neomoorella thermoacetica]|uniref:Transcriptional regulator, DeoR family n=1 Tax=Moorella thermoacetica (strain ATCC 39073 / JCM 9320) TaxID=264732 RepID=Q2RKM2_MOOTA|nr:DeoR/GlpR family DNA-binding transcription regulator [Moorella thermoacetica]AKX93441.1 glucitol operon repressor [Moorella thermoacetica]AKX96089.1 glucitol operon repressor [Moorella thermoacetica]OIQ55301.1 glucitol operon repressor [Moorella thermoacetica]OIQ55548.1 glucitol operon repressor [Moorella thermoacetica]QCZ99899.1 Glucitol operon repressor [Moorella thermoacetica]